ncbi:TPA: hypothetical protein EYP37_12680 [Candidatus Poribacteria bacterium]|nr:hypothetical protein [Candidatus Poribacteria bacterium]
MAIGILEDAPKGIVIKSEFTNCDLLALVWNLRELAEKIKEIDRRDDPVQLYVIRKLMDLETDPEIPLQSRDKIARLRQKLEWVLSNDKMDDDLEDEMIRSASRAEEILRQGNRMLEELLASRRRKRKEEGRNVKRGGFEGRSD